MSCSLTLSWNWNPPEPARDVGELTQALLLVNSSVAQVETYNNNAVKYNDSLCEVGLNIGRVKVQNQVKCVQINCDPWTEGVYQGTYTLKEVMDLDLDKKISIL